MVAKILYEFHGWKGAKMVNISLEATFPSLRVGAMTRPYYLRPGPTFKPSF